MLIGCTPLRVTDGSWFYVRLIEATHNRIENTSPLRASKVPLRLERALVPPPGGQVRSLNGHLILVKKDTLILAKNGTSLFSEVLGEVFTTAPTLAAPLGIQSAAGHAPNVHGAGKPDCDDRTQPQYPDQHEQVKKHISQLL
jgi:hypothetical protein